MFSIHFLPTFGDGEDEEGQAVGLIVLDDYDESLESCLCVWTRADYERQGREAVAQVLDGEISGSTGTRRRTRVRRRGLGSLSRGQCRGRQKRRDIWWVMRGDLGGIPIWAGIVSESDTIPAQKPIWNDSRPVGGHTVDRVGGRTHLSFQELFDHQVVGTCRRQDVWRNRLPRR